MSVYVAAALSAAVALILSRFVSVTQRHLVEHIDRRFNSIERFISMSNQDTVNAIVAQLGKARSEIVAKIADVQAQLDAAGADQVDLSELVAAAQALDDVVADAPAVEEAAEEIDPSV